MRSSVSAVRVVAILLVLAAVPGAVWIAGYLPPPSSPDAAVPGIANPRSAEQDWRGRVTAICDWERKRYRGIKEAFRRVASPADALLAFDSTIRLGRTSLAIFRRLDAPFAYQREARELERVIEHEQKSLVALRDALHDGNGRAFVRHAQEIGQAGERKRALFADLGLRGCLPRAPAAPPKVETRTV
jgi:hypothetical protein